MTLTGDLKTRELADVLLTTSRQRLTGILAVKSEQEVIGLSFVEGDIVGADCLSRTLEEGLGDLLVADRLIGENDLAAILSEHEESGDDLPRMLVDRGFIDHPTLMATLRERTVRLCLEALRWQDGDFKFYRGNEVANEGDIGPITVEEVVLVAAEELWEGGAESASVPTLNSVYQRSAPEDLQDAALRGVVEAMRGGLVDPGHEGKLILELVDGRRSATDLSRETGLSADKVRLNLYLLRRAGQVVPAGAGGGAVQPELNIPIDAQVESEPVDDVSTESTPSNEPDAQDEAKAPRLDSAIMIKWPGRMIAAGMALAAIGSTMLQPLDFLMSQRWQDRWRASFQHEQASATFYRIDQAARTFYLLEGRFPSSAREFEERFLLAGSDLTASDGRELLFSSASASYQVEEQRSAGREPKSAGGSIGGHFLLDPEIKAMELSDSPALVLLD